MALYFSSQCGWFRQTSIFHYFPVPNQCHSPNSSLLPKWTGTDLQLARTMGTPTRADEPADAQVTQGVYSFMLSVSKCASLVSGEQFLGS
jgi:hypothetical protein